MKYISLNWTLALKFSIGKKKRMRDCRILMVHDCSYTTTSLNPQNLQNIIKKVAKISIIQILMSNLSVKTTL